MTTFWRVLDVASGWAALLVGICLAGALFLLAVDR